MIISLYSVFDKKMGVFLSPFPARNVVEASRQIKAAMSDPQMRNADFVLTPSDFSLSRRADFDDERGLVIPVDDFVFIELASLAPGTVTP
nr:MAG: nonstructural protein [Microvirus sp.]QJB19682.1 MAG: nonstructural protein [Microvirus sp.]